MVYQKEHEERILYANGESLWEQRLESGRQGTHLISEWVIIQTKTLSLFDLWGKIALVFTPHPAPEGWLMVKRKKTKSIKLNTRNKGCFLCATEKEKNNRQLFVLLQQTPGVNKCLHSSGNNGYNGLQSLIWICECVMYEGTGNKASPG